MAAAQFDGIDIPLIYSIDLDREVLGDRRRTVGGKMRQDVVATKRQWSLLTRPMEKTDSDALVRYLEANKFEAGDFHLDEFGAGVTIEAYMRVERVVRSLTLPDRRSLELLVIEK
jgi:hypothetical protein